MNEKLGIIVSGGPAPGINSVIASVVINAYNRGWQAFGIKNGFKGIVKDEQPAIELKPQDVSHQANSGGSILGTSRYNPIANDKEKFISQLNKLGITKLVVIGGDGSAYLSHLIVKNFPQIALAHVPKTIDNDLILPNNAPSFGFETARQVGSEIIDTLIIDSRTTERWFIVTSMGRKAGFLALGLGFASGATLTLIPEEFENKKPTPEQIADIIFQSMLKRSKENKPYGTVILAEGIIDCLDLTNAAELKNLPRDDIGRLNYSEIEIGDVITNIIRQKIKDQNLNLKISTKNIGYELRCHAPLSYDLEYTKLLGYGAVNFLAQGKTGFMVARNYDRLEAISLSQMLDQNDTIKSRRVDLNSENYKVARSFMIR